MLKKRKKLVIVVLLSMAMAWLLFCTPIGYVVFASIKEIKLRHRIDHARLLAACRTVLADPKHYRPDPNVHPGSDETYFPDPKDPQMPPEIRSLGCSYIRIREKSLWIEMGGGFHHYGFFVPSDGGDAANMTELIKGLNFYSE